MLPVQRTRCRWSGAGGHKTGGQASWDLGVLSRFAATLAANTQPFKGGDSTQLSVNDTAPILATDS